MNNMTKRLKFFAEDIEGYGKDIFGATVTGDITFTTADLNKTYKVDKATAVTITLPVVPVAHVGERIKFLKRAEGDLTINCGGSDVLTIDGGNTHTSIANKTASQTLAVLELEVEAANTWGVQRIIGTWPTSA